INQLTTKIKQKQKQIILLGIQLGEDQNKNGSLTELLTQREKEVERLQTRLNQVQEKLTRSRKYNQNRIHNLELDLSKSRQESDSLQTKITNHTCSPCLLPHLPAPHVCPVVQQVNCSHTDYDSLKSHVCPDNSCSEEYHNEV